MKLVAKLTHGLVYAAVIGLLLPQVSLGDELNRHAVVRDVALRQGGTLHGTVMSAEGRHLPGASVSISTEGEIVGQTTVASDGRFVISGLRPGVFVVTTGKTTNLVRFWSEAAAPPAATPELLLIDQQSQVVRGAHGGHLPQWEHPFLVGGLLVTAGVVGGIIGYNIKDDAS